MEKFYLTKILYGTATMVRLWFGMPNNNMQTDLLIKWEFVGTHDRMKFFDGLVGALNFEKQHGGGVWAAVSEHASDQPERWLLFNEFRVRKLGEGEPVSALAIIAATFNKRVHGKETEADQHFAEVAAPRRSLVDMIEQKRFEQEKRLEKEQARDSERAAICKTVSIVLGDLFKLCNEQRGGPAYQTAAYAHDAAVMMLRAIRKESGWDRPENWAARPKPFEENVTGPNIERQRAEEISRLTQSTVFRDAVLQVVASSHLPVGPMFKG